MYGCDILFHWSCTIQFSNNGNPQSTLDFAANFTTKIGRWDAKDMIESDIMLNKLFNIIKDDITNLE